LRDRPPEKRREENMYARVTTIRFPPGLKDEVVGVARDSVAPFLREQLGFGGLLMLADPDGGKGIIVSLWEAEADAEESEASASYRDLMSRMASFLYEPLAPKTYEVGVWT
jgi:heme-degrading monooxygenase HmoA